MTANGSIDLNAFIRDVPDFPKPGILFRDITTLLGDARAFRRAVDELVQPWAGAKIDKVAGMEAGWWLPAQAAAATNPYAAAWFSYYTDFRFDNLDVTLATSQTILNGLVTTGLLSQAQADAVKAMGATTTPKYGPVLWGDMTLARKQLAGGN